MKTKKLLINKKTIVNLNSEMIAIKGGQKETLIPECISLYTHCPHDSRCVTMCEFTVDVCI